MSPSCSHIVVTKSWVDRPPVTELFTSNGSRLMEVEAADISDLPSSWRWPEPVTTVAADGVTPIYGQIFFPSDFDPDESYPVIDLAPCDPRYSYAYLGAFALDPLSCARYMHAAAFAELGFIVTNLSGRGSAYRSKAFHDHAHGQMHKGNDLDDHVEGLRQLASTRSWMDLDRVGAVELGGSMGQLRLCCLIPNFTRLGYPLRCLILGSRRPPRFTWVIQTKSIIRLPF